jgi:hypothetical protein
MSAELAQAIIAEAGKIGIDPVDLAEMISYETAGTFRKDMPGPKDRHGVPRSGLIQWGTDERKQYGVPEDMNIPGQMEAVGRYLVDRGVKPGMGRMDIYSAINAGRVGLYNRSDAHNGGAPGTVADKVNNQMAGHRKKAEALFGGIGSPQGTPATPQMAPQGILAAPAPQSAPAGLLAPANGGVAPAQQPAQGILGGGGMSPEEIAALMAPPKPLQHLQVFPNPPRKAGSAFRGYRA